MKKKFYKKNDEKLHYQLILAKFEIKFCFLLQRFCKFNFVHLNKHNLMNFCSLILTDCLIKSNKQG